MLEILKNLELFIQDIKGKKLLILRYLGDLKKLDFDNRRFKVVKNYVGYLKSTFGSSFIELPSESERKTHSFYTFFGEINLWRKYK